MSKQVMLQVRVDAVVALRNLVEAYHKDDLDAIKPLVPSLLDQLFALMKEASSPGPANLAGAAMHIEKTIHHGA